MKPIYHKLGLVLLASLGLIRSALAGDFLIRDGDRVVFLGDSITEQRLYTTYIEAYVVTRHPNWKLSFRNVGWGGDTSWLRQRAHPNEGQLFAAEESAQQKMIEDSVGRGLKRDVLPLKPTVVTVKFGMNDHSYQPFREDIFRAYTRSQAEIAKVLGASGARLAMLTPQPIEDKRPDPDKDVRNVSLRKFSDGLKDVASRSGVPFVDQFDPYMAIMLSARTTNPSAVIGGGDAVHPGPAGQTIMAWAILKSLGAASLVSRAEIDGVGNKVTASEGCRINNLKVAGGVVEFDRVDDSLPMPIDARAEPALKLAPILYDLNRYELRVTGLAGGLYEVKIHGEVSGRVTGEDLAKGRNAATTSGPITRQAQQVLAQIVRKNDLFFTRWRQVQLFDFPGWAKSPQAESLRAAELARLDQQIAESELLIETLRKPKPHHFQLTPVPQ